MRGEVTVVCLASYVLGHLPRDLPQCSTYYIPGMMQLAQNRECLTALLI